MKSLSRTVGEMEHDGLITGLTPEIQVEGGILGKLAEEATIVRGTILGKNTATGILSPYDGSTEPDCILCDDTKVGTTANENVEVYIAGCFDENKVTVASGYTLTTADKDKLRRAGIVFKAAFSE